MSFILICAIHSNASHILFFFFISLVPWVFWWICKLVSQIPIQPEISGPCFGIRSSPFEVLSGVPQGSVLGPMFFRVFINGIFDAVAQSKYLHFADDVRIYRAVKSPQDSYFSLTLTLYKVGALLTV
jgi:hypothetical protein